MVNHGVPPAIAAEPFPAFLGSPFGHSLHGPLYPEPMWKSGKQERAGPYPRRGIRRLFQFS